MLLFLQSPEQGFLYSRPGLFLIRDAGAIISTPPARGLGMWRKLGDNWASWI
jgi:hypothetical protein